MSLLAWPGKAGGPAHEIRFDFRTRQPIAPVRVNGARAVPFVFDTGASINVIDEDVAREAGLVGGVPQTMTGGGQGRVTARWTDGVVLETAGVKWTGQRASVVPLGYPDVKHFAGFVGAPILGRYVVQFDFPKRVLRLFEPGQYTIPRGAVVLPCDLQDGLPVVKALVDAGAGPVEARLMVDTGAGGTFADLNRPFVDDHRLLDIAAEVTSAARPAGIGGTAPFMYATGRRLILGGMAFDRPRLGLSRATEGSSSRRDREGIIGNALLEPFVLTVDYRPCTVTLEKPAS